MLEHSSSCAPIIIPFLGAYSLPYHLPVVLDYLALPNRSNQLTQKHIGFCCIKIALTVIE